MGRFLVTSVVASIQEVQTFVQQSPFALAVLVWQLEGFSGAHVVA